jgi:hypothetical protein
LKCVHSTGDANIIAIIEGLSCDILGKGIKWSKMHVEVLQSYQALSLGTVLIIYHVDSQVSFSNNFAPEKISPKPRFIRRILVAFNETGMHYDYISCTKFTSRYMLCKTLSAK